ncbi:RdRP-domain-containing protein [Gymnopus androsaceus JB14]|uniref:RNA-dependent RNA polymerase n=1 Tax=Gymnopus androsaceus JB14 TaxID=1447944 RepID=A0A6A4HF22_9AGAR|nr:RdRP-domain-containing protein [Gymnopus androsaceus JB14]
MDIFMRNIDFSATQQDVIRTLAKELHRQEYSPDTPINFHIRLFQPGRRGSWKRNSGCGLLTLPSIELGERFLSEYGEDAEPQRHVVIRAKRAFFKKSSKPLSSTNIVEQIQNSPYADPDGSRNPSMTSGLPDTARARVGSRLSRQQRLPESISLSRVQFGWDCRDQVFSVEWDHFGSPSIRFNPSEQQVEIHLSQPLYGDDFLGFDLPEYRILFKYSQISYLAVDSYSATEPVIIISLYTQPSFRSITFDSEDPYGFTHIPYERLSSLPWEDTKGRYHDEVAAFTSLSLRLVCKSRDGPTIFRRLAVERGKLKIPIEDYHFPAERRQLFSQSALRRFAEWLPTLDFDIACQLDALLYGHCADPRELLGLRPEVEYLISRMHTKGERSQNFVFLVFQDFAQRALDLFWNPGQDPREQQSLNACFMQCIRIYDNPSSKSLYWRRTDDGLFYCLHVQIMPSSISITGPLPERSNRVVRSYQRENRKYFIRVSFLDEGRLRLHHDRQINGQHYVAQRIAPFLIEGLREKYDSRPRKQLVIGGRCFNFLAYSQSALKEHAVWFLSPFEENGQTVNVQTVIQSLGSFSKLRFDKRLMYCPARFAARISQAFTSTEPTTTEVENVTQIADIESVDAHGNKWVHTDGVGTMSPIFAKKIYAEMNPRKKSLSDYPRALQIRFLGAKGMLSVDYRLTGMTIALRPSMIKFIGAPSKTIEIAKVFDKPTQFFLNRPLIVLYEGIGVPYETFKYYQDLAVEAACQAVQRLDSAGQFFQIQGIGGSFRLPTVMATLSRMGYVKLKDQFLDRILELGKKHVLRDLKHRARIPVPGAYNLVGIADVHQELGPNEISVCIMQKDSGKLEYLSGPCLVSRSPTIHPGDVQIVHAIGKPGAGSCFEHEPLPNTLVFSTRGERPIPSCLGGGDLDGDEYDIIPLDTLPKFRIPESQIQRPSLYNPAIRKELSRPCKLLDVAEFVMQYILSDVIGQVALTWRILADSSPKGILDPDCLRLADLHSQAVDYPKTGNPVQFFSIPKRNKYNKRLPDWYAPETMEVIDESRFYHSHKAIGRLFRDIDLNSSAKDDVSLANHIDDEDQEDIPLDELTTLMQSFSMSGSELDKLYRSIESYTAQFIDENQEQDDTSEVHEMFLQYCTDLQRICSMHNLSRSKSHLLTEEEAVVGTILFNTAVSSSTRNDHIRKVREETDVLVRGIYDTLYGAYFTPKQYVVRAFCSFRLATVYAQRKNPVFGAKSFWWVTLGTLFDSVGEVGKERKQQASSASKIERKRN